jgi:hypothetical protein
MRCGARNTLLSLCIVGAVYGFTISYETSLTCRSRVSMLFGGHPFARLSRVGPTTDQFVSMFAFEGGRCVGTLDAWGDFERNNGTGIEERAVLCAEVFAALQSVLPLALIGLCVRCLWCIRRTRVMAEARGFPLK